MLSPLPCQASLTLHARKPPRISAVKDAPVRTGSPAGTLKTQAPSASKKEPSRRDTPARVGSSYPAVKTSRIDIDAVPIHEPTGKPVTEVDMDAGTSHGTFDRGNLLLISDIEQILPKMRNLGGDQVQI